MNIAWRRRFPAPTVVLSLRHVVPAFPLSKACTPPGRFNAILAVCRGVSHSAVPSVLFVC